MSNTPPPPAKPKPQVDVNTLRARLVKAIAAISVTSHTATRSVLDAFISRCSPTVANDGAAGFPVTIRPHGSNPERAIGCFTVPACLIFHTGNAVLAYYDAVLKKDGADATLENRVAFLETVAKDGADRYTVMGDDRAGYYLMSREKAALVNQKRQEENEAKMMNRG